MANGKTLTGIDITGDEVHVVQLSRGGGAPGALGAYSARIPAGGEPFSKRAASALKSLIANNSLDVRNAAAILPGHACMFRSCLLPAGSEAELPGMARLEMEYASMLPPGGLCVSHFTIGPRLPGGFRTGISAATKTSVAELSEILKSAGVHPAVITSSGIAAAAYFAPLCADEDSILAIHGAKGSSSAYLITGQGLLMSHTFTNPEGAGKAGLDAVVAAARLCAEQAPFEQPSRVLLFGDTAALPSAEGISKALGLPAEISTGVEYDSDCSFAGLQRAAGAALELDPAQSTGANLLPSGMDAATRASRNRLAFRAAAAAAAVIAAIVISMSASAIREQSRQLAAADAKIAALKPRVAEIGKMRAALETMEPGQSAAPGVLDTMLELSKILPAGVFVTNLIYDEGGETTVSGETSTQLRVAGAIRALEQSRMFRGVQLSYSRQADTPGGAIVTFEIKASARRDGEK